jgi:hypothetical protein
MSDQAAVAQSPEERMLAFVEREDTPVTKEDEAVPASPLAPDAEDLPDTRTDAQKADAAEAANEDPATETEAERILRLKHDGVEIEKPESEVIALAQQGFDYTQKTQKLAEDRKAVETQAQALKAQEQAFTQQVQVQSALVQDVAKVSAIDLQLGQYQNVDWQNLSNTDPVEAQKLFFAYTQLKTQREQAVAEVSKKQQAFSELQNQSRAKQVELGRQVLEKEIPGWGPELAKSLVATGKEYGFNDNELSSLTDPRAVKLLHDAAQWRKLQSSKTVTDKKVAAASPPVKPGARDNRNAESASIKANREALRKTGKADYAAKLIEKML